jgi:hypothetical protein
VESTHFTTKGSKRRGVSFLRGKEPWKGQFYGQGKLYLLEFKNSEIEAAENHNRLALLVTGPIVPIKK